MMDLQLLMTQDEAAAALVSYNSLEPSVLPQAKEWPTSPLK
jgi:hypothetical protein